MFPDLDAASFDDLHPDCPGNRLGSVDAIQLFTAGIEVVVHRVLRQRDNHGNFAACFASCCPVQAFKLTFVQLSPGIACGNGGGKPDGKGGGKGKNKVVLPAVGNTPASWGRPVDYLPNGKPFKFERFSNGIKFVTHVSWAPDEDPGHGDHH